MVFTRLLSPCIQPCTEEGVNKVEISIWHGTVNWNLEHLTVLACTDTAYSVKYICLYWTGQFALESYCTPRSRKLESLRLSSKRQTFPAVSMIR